MTETILEVKDLHISFDTFAGKVNAIRGVDFSLKKGETLAIVGESGSGKSVTTRTIMGLLANNGTIEKGEILFKGCDLTKNKEKEYQKIRGKDIAMIFQDPMTSLDPTMTIGKQVSEGLRKHKKVTKKEATAETLRLLELVGIPDAQRRLNNYPHQFSGGQRQRIVIAIALITHPEIIIADEPTTALDVTIQAQILELLQQIQEKIDMSIIFITHDLGVVANVADKVAVMYGGKIVEIGTSKEIFYNPQHPYTWGLLSSMPTLDTSNQEELYAIPGTPPNLLHPPVGDAFAARNAFALAIDFEEEPPYFDITPTHKCASWLLEAHAPKVNAPAEIKKRYAYFEKKYESEGTL